MGTTSDELHDIYVLYYERVVRYLVRKHELNVEEARDLAQDVFLSVFRHMEQKPVAAMWLFLKTTAHNKAVNEIRSRIIRRRTYSGSSDALPNLEDALLRDFWTDEPPPSPEAEASGNEERLLLRDAIEKLPDVDRQCLLLWLRGLSYDEIGVAMRISTHAVRTRLRDARKLLRSWVSGGNHGEN